MVEPRESRWGFRFYSFREVADGTMDREEKARHVINLDKGIDGVGKIEDDEQLAHVWCATHQAWEWLPHRWLKPAPTRAPTRKRV
jgi:hypothetical protein